MPMLSALAEPLLPRRAAVAAACLVGVFGVLVFGNLGAYPFWGDEADTVIFAHGVWETGDTDARYGQNVYLYRNGALLEHLKNRALPPLPYYAAAPFWATFGDVDAGMNTPTARFGMRLPFALCGLTTMALACWWLYRSRATAATWLCVGGALALNVSLALYSRQCRYYGLATLLTALVAYFYRHFDGRLRQLVGLVAAMCLLAATHYLAFVAVAAALVVDYAVWRRREIRLALGQWLGLILPVAVAFAGLVVVYNPLGKSHVALRIPPRPLLDKLALLWLSIRDLNACECGAMLVLAATPLVARLRRDALLLRMWAACCVYVAIVVVASPQEARFDWLGTDIVQEADVRYFAALVPLLVVVTVRTLTQAVGGRLIPAVALTAVCIFSNIVHVPWSPGNWRSTLGEFVAELREPRRPSSDVLARWLREHVPAGQLVWIVPNAAWTAPSVAVEWRASQIVHAPHVRQAWQLNQPDRPAEFAALPSWQHYGGDPVDAIVFMGYPPVDDRGEMLRTFPEAGYRFEFRDTLPTFYDDRTRPELLWHWFREQAYDTKNQQIYIYARRR